MFSIGGGFLWHHQSYYLVQQQETVALQLPYGKCSNGLLTNTSFVWQIHPVLGKTFVRAGTQFNFVQISIPYSLSMRGSPIADACIRIGWRKTSDHGNKLDSHLVAPENQCFKIRSYTTDPVVRSVSVTDIGSGSLWVRATGGFPSGTGVRIGNTILSPRSVNISSDEISLSFYAKATDLANAEGASLLSRDGDEIPLLNPELSSPPGAPIPPPATPLRISNVAIRPYSDSQSLVTVVFTRPTGASLPFEPCVIPGAVNPPPCIPGDPYLVRIGTKLYGLTTTPYLWQGVTQLQFLADNDVIAAAPELEMFRLLWPPQYYYAAFPLNKGAVMIGKATLIAGSPVLKFSLTGTNLDEARLLYPECSSCYLPEGSNFATIALQPGTPGTGLDAAGIKGLKDVIICKRGTGGLPCADGFSPLTVAIPTDESDNAKSQKPKLDKHAAIPLGTVEVKIIGTSLDQIVSIRFNGNSIAYRLSQDKQPALLLELPPAINGVAGQYPLRIELVDKSTMSYVINMGGSAEQ